MLDHKDKRVKKTERRRPNADDTDWLSAESSLVFTDFLICVYQRRYQRPSFMPVKTNASHQKVQRIVWAMVSSPAWRGLQKIY